MKLISTLISSNKEEYHLAALLKGLIAQVTSRLVDIVGSKNCCADAVVKIAWDYTVRFANEGLLPAIAFTGRTEPAVRWNLEVRGKATADKRSDGTVYLNRLYSGQLDGSRQAWGRLESGTLIIMACHPTMNILATCFSEQIIPPHTQQADFPI